MNKKYKRNYFKAAFITFALLMNASLAPIASAETNLITNPGLESGTSPWVFYTNGAGTFLNDAPGQGNPHAGHIKISQQGTNVQFYQEDIALEPNTAYRLAFKAYSNTGHDLKVSLLKHGSPYTNYGLSNYVVNLGTNWGSYTIEFTTSGFSGMVNDARLMYVLGPYDAATDQYYFDNVILSKVSSVTPIPTSTPFPQITPTPTPTPNPGSLLFVGDFETGTSSQWPNKCVLQSDRLQIVTSPKRQGKYAAKFTVKSGDECWSTNSERTELAVWTNNAPHEKEGDNYYYAWSTYFPADWTPVSNWGVITQWHAPITALTINPPIAIDIDSRNRIFLAVCGGDMTGANGCTVEGKKSVIFVPSLTKEKWNDFIVHIKWSVQKKGMVEIWHRLEGQSFIKVVSLVDISTLQYQPGASSTISAKQQGLYRSPTAATQTIYHDGYRMGTTFESVLY